MTTPICVGPSFRATGNVLDISFYWGRRAHQTNFVPAVNDGAFTTQTSLPGLNHIDTTQTFVNATGIDLRMWVEIQPGSKYVKASQPNLVFLRHRATQAVGVAPVADDPNLLTDFDSEFGGGLDLITADDAVPLSGVAEFSQPVMPYWLDEILVPAGQSLQVKYRCAHYSPDPWSDTANNNVATYDATARWVNITFWGATDYES